MLVELRRQQQRCQAGGGTLTIQGDNGNPTLVENFNPFQPTTELHGTYLIYAPLETVSTIRLGQRRHVDLQGA